MRWLALSLLAVACDTGAIAMPPTAPPSAPPPPDFASGTRLDAVAWEVDGAQLLRHFFDRERNEACAFVVGPGPAYWCLPLDAPKHDASGALALFADSGCKQGFALAPLTGPAAYIIDRPADACAASPAVHRAGPVQKLQPYALDGGRCRRLASAAPGHVMGELVPLESFVRAEERPDVSAARIASLTLVASDGARLNAGAWDRGRNAAARVQDPGTIGDWRWFPSRIAFAGAGSVLFGDSACTASVATKIARDAVCPLSAAFSFEGACGAGDFIELGPALLLAGLHERGDTNACVAAAPGTLAYDRGARIPRGSFAAAYPVERGGERVKLRGWSDGVTTPSWDTFVDVASNEPCTPAPAVDETMRCLPTAATSLDYFADAACTLPAFERAVDECNDVAAPGFVRVDTRVFHVTGPSALYQRAGAACTKRETTTTRGYAVEEVDVSRFAPATSRRLAR